MIIGDIETTEKVEYEDLLKNYYEKMEIIEEQDKEIEKLHSIIKEAINYIDDNTYYKDHKGHINIDDLYLILQKGSESNE